VIINAKGIESRNLCEVETLGTLSIAPLGASDRCFESTGEAL